MASDTEHDGKPQEELKRARGESGAVAKKEDLQPTWTDKDGVVHRKRILTGDRTTGKLHLGHYVGSLRNRVELQHKYDTYILMADVQALTTHWENPKILKQSVMDVALDYLAIGLEPYTGGEDDGTKVKIVVQSAVPSIAELTVLYGLVTPMSLLDQNPTTKAEAEQYGFGSYQTSTRTQDLINSLPDSITANIDETQTKLTRLFPELREVSPEEIVEAAIALIRNKEVSTFNDVLKIADDIRSTANQLPDQIESLEDALKKEDFDTAREVFIPLYRRYSVSQHMHSISGVPQEAERSSAFKKIKEYANKYKSKVFIDGSDPKAVDRWVRSLELEPALQAVLQLDHIAVRLRDEIITLRRRRGKSSMPYGFLGYPVSQAADITFVNAHLVPVGDDQVPHIELTREIVRRVNKTYGGRRRILVEPQALLGSSALLKALDGSAKMSKSLGNAVYLSDSDTDIWKQLKVAVTDPQRVRREDPGRPEVCNVFSYHQQFCGATEPGINESDLGVATVEEVAENCRGAKWGCVDCKKNLMAKLTALLDPIRERRTKWEQDKDGVMDILKAGTRRGNEEGNATVDRVKSAMHVDYWD